MTWKIVEAREIYSGWCRLLIAKLTRPDGSVLSREIEDHGIAACVLPYDPVRKTAVVIRQMRAPLIYAGVREDLVEGIAGLIDDGEDPVGAARREAMEEAGLRLTHIDHVTTAWTMPGMSTERMALMLAEYGEADRVAPGGGLAEEHEEIEVIELGLHELAAMVEAGTLTDMKLLFLVQTLRLRRPDLFL
jgi:nudix-type nucleoside diphosphatase (YffH/AdpP family)